MQLKNKTELIKASPAIHIQRSITHLQRRAWNVLLANAYDELLTREVHSIKVAELMEKLEFDSHNREYLLEFLEALVSCKLKWNLLNKDKQWEIGVAALLSSVVIREDGTCTYAFDAQLRPQLYNPRIYARINLRLQNKFRSKYALILWELCMDYFDEKRGEGETAFIPLQTFRELMGLSENEYPQFKLLNHHVIKKPLTEISGLTSFSVKVEYQRKGRRVIAIKFKIHRVQGLPEQEEPQGSLFADLEDLPPIAIELTQAGITRAETLKIVNQQWEYVVGDRPDDMEFEDYIWEKIDLMQRQKDTLEKPTGFLLTAIQENYPNPDYQAEQKAKAEQEIQQQIKQLEREKEELKESYEAARDEILAEIVEEVPELIDEIVPSILEEKPVLNTLYDSGKTTMKNYERAPIRMPVNAKLKERFPQRFSELGAKHEANVRELDNQIVELKTKLQ